MEKKIVLITGCSSGIGQALATEFLGRGFRVWATARKTGSIQSLPGKGCNILELDVTDVPQMKSAVNIILEKEKRIDILVNNAGYGLMGPSVEIPYDEITRQFETNLFGPFELIKLVTPAMIAQKSGTIVNIGSISGIAATPFSGPYCASKAALHALTDSLRMELAPFGVNVISVRPGAIASNFGKNAGATIARVLKPGSLYSAIEGSVRNRANTSQENATPVEVFAKRIVKIILQKNPPAVVKLGKLSFLLPFMKRCLPEKLLDKILRKKYGLNQL